MSMAGIRLIMVNEESHRAFGVMSAISMVYADMQWDEFRKHWEMPEDESNEMRAEFRHFIIHTIHENPEALSVMLTVWGKEKTTNYINELCEAEKNG